MAFDAKEDAQLGVHPRRQSVDFASHLIELVGECPLPRLIWEVVAHHQRDYTASSEAEDDEKVAVESLPKRSEPIQRAFEWNPATRQIGCGRSARRIESEDNFSINDLPLHSRRKGKPVGRELDLKKRVPVRWQVDRHRLAEQIAKSNLRRRPVGHRIVVVQPNSLPFVLHKMNLR